MTFDVPRSMPTCLANTCPPRRRSDVIIAAGPRRTACSTMLERLRNLDVMVDDLGLATRLDEVEGATERRLGLYPVAVHARDLQDAGLPHVGQVDLGRGAMQVVTDPGQKRREEAAFLLEGMDAAQTKVDAKRAGRHARTSSSPRAGPTA